MALAVTVETKDHQETEADQVKKENVVVMAQLEKLVIPVQWVQMVRQESPEPLEK